ncbi:MAG TPA: endonuclease/exonuclease/phosphatase family protein [Jiangellales bacterium]|nr:endonuclease/exonuclease/phosphatase family protein [Jiangellales bacterium]
MLTDLATEPPAPRGTGVGRRLARVAVPVLVSALVGFLGPSTAQASGYDEQGNHTGQVARVLTRNLFLGADLAPALAATSLSAFVEANGAVLRQTTATNFPTRANGLAAEILEKQPDLVGLQEVALWRTGPASVSPLFGGPKTATTVRYDFLQLLLDRLNAGEERYRPVVVQLEFDFEAPANENGVRDDGPQPTPDAELNGRLTMRDVILARVDGGVQTWAPTGGNFQHLLTLSILGVPVTVTRGWTQVEAKVRGGVPFRFVNTHLEAFDPRTVYPSIRAVQAGELVAPGGPATSDLPVVLLGDLNSDDDTVVPDDQQAYRVLLGAGFVERSTADPLSCCIHSYDLMTGTAAEFDHQVDHVMTDSPRTVRLVESSVTGRTMQNGYWDSDHAGVFSALRIG